MCGSVTSAYGGTEKLHNWRGNHSVHVAALLGLGLEGLAKIPHSVDHGVPADPYAGL